MPEMTSIERIICEDFEDLIIVDDIVVETDSIRHFLKVNGKRDPKDPDHWITKKGRHIPIFYPYPFKDFSKEEKKTLGIFYDTYRRFIRDIHTIDITIEMARLAEYINKHPVVASTLRKLKKIAKRNMYPFKIRGVKKGEEMSHLKADRGRVNPEYGFEETFRINCQVCVLIYEMRRRGYDVCANSRMSTLSRCCVAAWLDPETGLPPIPRPMGIKTKQSCVISLEHFASHLISGARYHVFWKNRKKKWHIVTMTTNGTGLEIYDPQDNSKMTWYSIGDIPSYINLESLGYYRVDNLAFNPYFMHRAAKTEEEYRNDRKGNRIHAQDPYEKTEERRRFPWT